MQSGGTSNDLPASPAAAPPSDDGFELSAGVRVPRSGLRFAVSRSSGPGGQNVNKLNTRVELWLSVAQLVGLDDPALHRLRVLAGSRLTAADEIHIASQASRSQEGNRQDALRKLSELIERARRVPKPRKKTKPSRAARQRRLDSKRRRSQVKSNRRGSGVDAT